MKKNPVLALIIALPSPLLDGLLALMTTSDLINAVLVAEEASQALRMVKDHHPNLVLLDSHLPQARMILERIKNDWPQTRCLALVGSVEQEQTFKDADAVLLEVLSGRAWLAVIIVGFGWALQHSALPLMLDWRWAAYRFGTSLLVGIVMAIFYLRIRRLLPLIIAHWAANFLAVLTSVFLPLLNS